MSAKTAFILAILLLPVLAVAQAVEQLVPAVAGTGVHLLLAIGGAVGAFIRRLADPSAGTWTQETAGQVFAGGISMVILGSAGDYFGFIPPELAQALSKYPVLTFAAAAFPTYSGVDLAGLLFERYKKLR